MPTANHDEPPQSNGVTDANIVDLVSGGDAKAVRGLALPCGLSTASRRTRLQPGDLLLSVNEVEVTDHEAAAMLIRAAPDQLVLRFRRPPPNSRMRTTTSDDDKQMRTTTSCRASSSCSKTRSARQCTTPSRFTT